MKPLPPLDHADIDYVVNTTAELWAELRGQRLFVRDGLDGGPILVTGDGSPHRSYLHAADLAVWLWTILIRDETCRPYNVGSEQALAIRPLAAHVAAGFQPEPASTVTETVPLTRRAALELALLQTIDIDTAVTRTFIWPLRATGTDQG